MFQEYMQELAQTGTVQFFVRVLPNAARTYAKDRLADGSIKVAVKAVAEHGKANQALRMFLAQQFDVHASQVAIVSGLTNREKLVRITR